MPAENRIVAVSSAITLFEFHDFAGNPVAAKSTVEIEQQSGSTGVALWRSAKHGQPFTLRSKADFASFAAAQIGLASYRLLVDGDPVDVWWQGSYFGTCGVLNVESFSGGMYALAGGVGGFAGTPGAFLEADWQFVIV